MFQKLGVINFSNEQDEDALMEAALDAGAEDVVTHEDGSFEVLTKSEEFMLIRDALVQAGFPHEHAEVTMRADNLSPVDVKDAEKILRLLDVLEDLDDVQNVYSNADFPDEIMQGEG
jgi:transcriptional/translational regulatory protein YebC/TACO1